MNEFQTVRVIDGHGDPLEVSVRNGSVEFSFELHDEELSEPTWFFSDLAPSQARVLARALNAAAEVLDPKE